MTNQLGFEGLLSGVEAQLEAISQALGGQDPEQLEACAQGLRDVSLALSQVALPAPQHRSPELNQRMQAISARLGVLRESLQRLAVHAERAVTTLLPRAGESDTYGKSWGRSPGGLPKPYKS